MPDEEKAESSPVENIESNAESQAPQESSEPEPVGIFDEEPKKTAKADKSEEDSAPSEPEPEDGESVTASEAAERSGEEQEKPSKAERRIKQLTAQVKALERQMEAAQQPESSGFQQLREPVAPDIDTFQGSAEEFKQAQKNYQDQYRNYVVQLDRMQQQQKQVVEHQKKVDAEAKANWEKRQERVLKENPEFNVGKILRVVQPNPTTDGFMLDSEVGPEILNHLYENPDDADRIRQMSPYASIRELVRLENQYLDRIKGIKSKPTPVKPPKKVGGQQAGQQRRIDPWDVLYG